MRGRWTFAIAATALLLAPAARADDGPSPAPPIIDARVELVVVDAVVSDRDGRHVEDLRAEDFEVREDGRSRQIVNFAYVPVRTAAARVLAPDEDGTADGDSAQRLPYTLAIVVDDLGLSWASVPRVKAALLQVIDRLGPDDRVAILRTTSGVGTMQQLTNDHERLRQAVERIRFNAMSRGSVQPAEAPVAVEGLIEGIEAVDQRRDESLTSGTLGALAFVVRGLGQLPGRKNVVVVSEGFRTTDDRQLDRALRALTEEAGLASVVLHTIDPRGLGAEVEFGATEVDAPAAVMSAVGAARITDARARLRAQQQRLAVLPRSTGGLDIANNNDIARAFGRVLADGQGYYLLGYEPPEAETHPGRTPHRIQVKVKRPGLRVRARKVAYGPQPVTDTSPRSGRARLLPALVSPFGAEALGITLSALFVYDPKAGPVVRTLVHVAGEGVSFGPTQDGMAVATLDVVAAVFDMRGQGAGTSDQTYTVRAAPDALAEVHDAGLVYRFDVPVAGPGAYQVRAVVRDGVSDRIGAASQFVDVADVGTQAPLALSGLGLSGSGGDRETVLRRFPAGTLSYTFQVLNARKDRDGRPSLEALSKVTRDGRPLRSQRLAALEQLGRVDGDLLLVTGRLALGDLEPGSYGLEIEILDRHAAQRARQVTEFEIVP